MRNLHNIEKSAFRKGVYVGYGAGLVWHITRSNSSSGNWCARPAPHMPDAQLYASIYAMKLEDMSRKLENTNGKSV